MPVRSLHISSGWLFAASLLAPTLLSSGTAQGQSKPFASSFLSSDGLDGFHQQGDRRLVPSIQLAQNQPPATQPPTTQPPATQPAPVPPVVNPNPPPQVVGGPFELMFAGMFETSSEPPRLSDSPDIFGDSHERLFGSEFMYDPNFPKERNVITGISTTGLSQRLRIAESNKALPVNRFFFHYNHFHNAVRFQRSSNATGQFRNALSLDSYVIGAERVFDDGYSSVEVRMPFTSGGDFSDSDFEIDNGNIGNLSVVLKRMVHESQSTIVAVGLGITVPTGSDIRGDLPQLATRFTIANEAVHIVPFIGFLSTLNDRLFVQGFAQVDVAANGNPINIISLDRNVANSGTFNEQTLFSLDAATGYWLLKDRVGHRLTGLAAVLELHYTTALQDTDSVSAGDGSLVLTNTLNRFDVVNLTMGMHAQINHLTDVRFGAVVPLRNSQSRFFDSELMVSVVRRY